MNCLYTIPYRNFGFAFSYAICVIKNFGNWGIYQKPNPPRFSFDTNYPGKTRNLKLPTAQFQITVLVHFGSVWLWLVTVLLVGSFHILGQYSFHE